MPTVRHHTCIGAMGELLLLNENINLRYVYIYKVCSYVHVKDII